MKAMRKTSVALALLLAALPWFAGCASDGASKVQGEKPSETAPAEKPASTKGAAQIWAENCSRCHNARSPSSYSDAQWEVIGHHMRVRGYLTAEEQKTIVEFLKAGN